MNIAKCPLCGNKPKIKHWSLVDGDVSIHCCGVTIDGGEKLWNQYAAAIELAKAKNTCSRYFLRDEKQIELKRAVYDAEQRVLEMFK